jgi:LuxR family maltose regulon positive regulatory protein
MPHVSDLGGQAARESSRAWIRPSKLRGALRRGPTVERERLLNLLQKRAEERLLLISASAGYGKSILAAQWAERCERPFGWITLDRGDNDTVNLLRYLAHALDGIAPLEDELFEELLSPAPAIDDVVLPALAAGLERLPPFLLVLDDAQELRPRAIAVLDSLLEETPPGSQVVLATRTDPDLLLSRRRVAGDLIELRADDLALDLEETRALAEAHDAQLSDSTLTLIHEQTEGWPAGITLAIRSVDGADADEILGGGIEGGRRDIGDYLFDTVLARETEERRTFLLATSVLNRMTASLCDTIREAVDSTDVLRELERSNSFVIPLDDHRGWYRYHQLFGEFLRTELDRRHPELAAAYLARAAAWHEEEGADPEEAFRCAREARDFARAGRIALSSAVRLVGGGHHETMLLWLEDCGEEDIVSDSQLALAAAWVCLMVGNNERAERLVRAVEERDLDVPSSDGATSLRSTLATIRGSLGFRGANQMLADGEYVYAAESQTNTHWVVGGCRAIGSAHMLLGHPQEAIAALEEGISLDNRPELRQRRLTSLSCFSFLAFAAADSGDWPTARKRAREASALVAEHRFEHATPGTVAFTARAIVLSHDGDLDRARHELARARAGRDLVRGWQWLWADLELRWGNLSLDLGDRVVAYEHAAFARSALRAFPDPGILPSRLAALEERIASAADLHLTPAELRVLPFLPTHLTVKEIAARLFLSPATVKTQLAAVYSKLDATTRSEAVERMEQLGLQPTWTPTSGISEA